MWHMSKLAMQPCTQPIGHAIASKLTCLLAHGPWTRYRTWQVQQHDFEYDLVHAIEGRAEQEHASPHAAHHAVEQVEDLLRCPAILGHAKLDSYQLDLQSERGFHVGTENDADSHNSELTEAYHCDESDSEVGTCNPDIAPFLNLNVVF